MRSTKIRRFLFRVCGVLLLAFVAFPGAHAQTGVGRISGTVQDAKGANIPNASVKVVNQFGFEADVLTYDRRPLCRTA